MSERLNDSYLDAIDDPVEQAIEAGAQPPPRPGRRPSEFLFAATCFPSYGRYGHKNYQPGRF